MEVLSVFDAFWMLSRHFVAFLKRFEPFEASIDLERHLRVRWMSNRLSAASRFLAILHLTGAKQARDLEADLQKVGRGVPMGLISLTQKARCKSKATPCLCFEPRASALLSRPKFARRLRAN